MLRISPACMGHMKKGWKFCFVTFLMLHVSKMFLILRNILPWYSRRYVNVLFCVFQTNLIKGVNIFYTLPEWIRNIQMIHIFSNIKTWMRILHG